MKKKILLFAALCFILHVNAQTTWTVINNQTVTTGGAAGSGNSGNLQYCVENAVKGDIIVFDASLSGQTILFGEISGGAVNALNPQAISIDASALVSPVIFDGQNAYPIIKSTAGVAVGDTLRFKNIIFQNGSTATTNYAGALATNSHLIVENCKFVNNAFTATTGDGCGGIKMGTRNAVVRISDCIFKNNSSANRGGALWFPSNQSLIERCCFTENQTGNQENSAGAVMYFGTGQGPNAEGSFVEFRNCTMVNNYSGKAKHGIVVCNDNTNVNANESGSFLRFINCTVYGNVLNGSAAGATIAAIYTAKHKIVVGGCLMANNNASDIRTNTGIFIESLGYNTYHEFHQRNAGNTASDYESISKAATDVVYNNTAWGTAPLAAEINADGVMIPISTDETLFATNIQRIPAAVLAEWHGENPVDQLGETRTEPGSVGAYQATGNETPPTPSKKITIYGIGDSTMSDYTVYSTNLQPRTGWGQCLGAYFTEGVTVANHARSGRTTASFLSEGLWTPIVSALKTGDYVFIQFGHNDEKDLTTAQYRTNLARFIGETRQKGAIPVLLTPIARRQFSGNTLQDTHGQFPPTMRQLAADSAVYLIDLTQKSMALVQSLGVEGSKAIYLYLNAGEYPNYPNGSADNTHLSPYGANEIARLAVEGIKELNITPLVSSLKTTSAVESTELSNKKFYFSNGKLHIANPQKGVLFFYNMTGVLLKSVNINESVSNVDYSFLEKGIYFVRMSMNKNNFLIKIIKD